MRLPRPQIYIESYHSVPKGECQTLIKAMAWTFFTSWVMFPILFAAGPEGLGVLTPYGSTIGHTVADLLSKNLWGLIGHHLRVKVRPVPHLASPSKLICS
jgi:bacteriorhodopsin